jgi:hypothetical protein
MNDLLLHDITDQQITAFVRQPGQALILAGPAGSGKLTLARRLASTILAVEEARLDDYPYKLIISTPDSSIGIDEVRRLEHFLSLKVPGRAAYNRAVIIENAHSLTAEAQNALLKALEEPPAATLIVLTADNEQALLPTIRSRAPVVYVRRPVQTDVERFFESDFDKAAVAQAYAVSGGLPGLMQAMLSDTDHPLLQATERARKLLSQPVYERLLSVDELSRQRELARDVIFILQQMARISLQNARADKASRWQAILKAAYEAAEALDSSAQPKLVLTNLMLSF